MTYIYQITGNRLTYYGCSSKSLKERIRRHISKHNSTMSRLIINSTGKWKMEIIENSFKTIDEAKQWETWYIINNECINKRIELTNYIEPIFLGPIYIKKYSSKLSISDLKICENSLGALINKHKVTKVSKRSQSLVTQHH